MTQEELDSLVKDDADISDIDISSEFKDSEETSEEQGDEAKSDSYQFDSNAHWPPPPPNQEHKVVYQLDDVTRESERKSVEMIDKLELINSKFTDSENKNEDLLKILNKNIEVFTKLNEKFPHVETFKEVLENNIEAHRKTQDAINGLQDGQDEVMIAIDAMQYQDIHRQKIERVINVMRSLSRYMTSLFESQLDDKKRVGSAVHIEGDSSDVVSNDDIEALIANFGQK